MRKLGAIARYPQIIVPDSSEGGIFRDTSDISVNARKADRIRKVVSENYGHAGRKLIDHLVDNKDKAAAELECYAQTCVKGLKNTFPSHGQQQRFVDSFAKVYAAGRLAIKCGIAPFNKIVLDRAVSYAFEQALQALCPRKASYPALFYGTFGYRRG